MLRSQRKSSPDKDPDGRSVTLRVKDQLAAKREVRWGCIDSGDEGHRIETLGDGGTRGIRKSHEAGVDDREVCLRLYCTP